MASFPRRRRDYGHTPQAGKAGRRINFVQNGPSARLRCARLAPPRHSQDFGFSGSVRARLAPRSIPSMSVFFAISSVAILCFGAGVLALLEESGLEAVVGLDGGPLRIPFGAGRLLDSKVGWGDGGK
jgi:hypothetical protein